MCVCVCRGGLERACFCGSMWACTHRVRVWMGVLGPSQCPPVHPELVRGPQNLTLRPHCPPGNGALWGPGSGHKYTTPVQASRGQRTSGHLCQAMESPRASWVSSHPECPALSRASLGAGAHTWPSAALPPSGLRRRGERCLGRKEEAAPPLAGARQAAGAQVSPAGPSVGDPWDTRRLRAAGFGLNCGRSPRSPVPRSQAWRQGLQSFWGSRPPDVAGPWWCFPGRGQQHRSECQRRPYQPQMPGKVRGTTHSPLTWHEQWPGETPPWFSPRDLPTASPAKQCPPGSSTVICGSPPAGGSAVITPT